MPITLVNRSESELTIPFGEDKTEKLVFTSGERKDGIDGSKCADIEEQLFVKAGLIEVFGNPKDDIVTSGNEDGSDNGSGQEPDKRETLSQKRAREKAEATDKANAAK